MKCPICGEQLRPGKKDPNYLLCYNCRKKFKAPQKKSVQDNEEEEKAYSNIPPKAVRDKRERKMKQAYDEMLAIDEESTRKKKTKARRYEEPEDNLDEEYDDDYDYDEKVSKVPIIILGIAIVVVAGIIAFMLLK